MNKLYFHIGCTYSKETILQKLIDKNFKLIVLDDIGIKPANRVQYHSIFSKTYEEIKDIIFEIIEAEKIDIQNCHFFTLAEGSVDLLNQLLKDFNKPPISRYSGSLKDKYWVRKKFDQYAIESLDYHALVKNPSEIPDPTPDKFPLIVKPIGSMASRNVFKVVNRDELRKACLEIFIKNKTFVTVDHGEIVLEEVYKQHPFAVIESCLHGEKLSFETLINDGKIQFCAVTSKFDYDNDFFYERADIVDPHFFDEKMNKKLHLYLENIVAALEIDSTILHIEVFFDRKNSNFHLIEVNFRMGGDNIHELVTRAYQIDIVVEFLTRLSGLVPNQGVVLSNHLDYAWVGFYFMTGVGGEFNAKSIKAFDNEIEWDFTNGEKVTKFTTSKFYKLGTVMFPATKEQIKPRLNHLLKNADAYFITNPTL